MVNIYNKDLLSYSFEAVSVHFCNEDGWMTLLDNHCKIFDLARDSILIKKINSEEDRIKIEKNIFSIVSFDSNVCSIFI